MEYKILSFKAKDLYKKIYFDGNGQETLNQRSFVVDLGKDSKLFKSTMEDSLELRYLLELINTNKLNDTCYNENLLYSIVNVSFDDVLFPYQIIYPKEKKSKEYIFAKTGYDDEEEIRKALMNDTVFKKNGKLIAIKTNSVCEIDNTLNEDEEFKKYFEYDEEQKIYKYSFTNVGKKSKKGLRKRLYSDGFEIIFDNNFTIKYKRYKRSSSEARGGNCLFIDERLYDGMNNWSYFYMPKNNQKVMSLTVEIEAYKSLTLSSIEDTIEIDPKSIVILPDYEYKFKSTCIKVSSIENNDKKKTRSLFAEEAECEISNNLFDGEGLIDSRIFEDFESNKKYKDKSMLLLRNSYFKCCVFNTNLKEWFLDNKIENISQLNEKCFTKAKRIEDIRLVITYSSLKFIKFSDEFQDRLMCGLWCSKVPSTFGVIKTDHPGKRFSGNLVETSYQFLNTLNLTENEVVELTKDSCDYIKLMRPFKHNKGKPRKENDIESSVLKFYLNGEELPNDSESTNLFNETIDRFTDIDSNNDDTIFENSEELITEEEANLIYSKFRSELCYELLNINDEFEKTSLYCNLRNTLTNSLAKDLIIHGNVLIKGTNATIFGNGYEFLQYLIGKFDGKSSLIKPGEVMITMFNNEENLCGVRYPHITMGNLYKVKNKIYDEYNNYFKLSKQIICVNAIDENIQHRLNGCDYDSDFMTVTNNQIIYNAVDKHYNTFKVPFNNVPKEQTKKKDMYYIDDEIANNRVGEITNLSQHLNSIYWDMYSKNGDINTLNELYKDICKLAIMSNTEIDKAKRHYEINVYYELLKIKGKWLKDSYSKYPSFLYLISKEKGNTSSKETYEYNTTMTYINRLRLEFGKSKNHKDLIEIINKKNNSNSKVYETKAVELKSLIKTHLDKIEAERKYLKLSNNDEDNRKSKKDFNLFVKNEWFECYKEAYKPGNKLLTDIRTVKYFINSVKEDKDITDKTKENYLWTLLYVLYLAKNDPNNKYNDLFYKTLKKNQTQKLKYDENGNIKLFDFKFICE